MRKNNDFCSQSQDSELALDTVLNPNTQKISEREKGNTTQLTLHPTIPLQQATRSRDDDTPRGDWRAGVNFNLE
jgi:hypothetical protein